MTSMQDEQTEGKTIILKENMPQAIGSIIFLKIGCIDARK
jgi:hypothetical protein